MKINLKIEGMHCKSCAKTIELELEDKVNQISVNSSSKEALIDFDERKITEMQIKNIIIGLGYQVK